MTNLGTITLIKEGVSGHMLIVDVNGQRYFGYLDKQIAGPPPVRGARVLFTISSRQPRVPGQLPYARDIVVLESERNALQNIFSIAGLNGGSK